MEYIDYVNREMKKINDLTDEIYEALADNIKQDLVDSVVRLQKLLEKLRIHGGIRKQG